MHVRTCICAQITARNRIHGPGKDKVSSFSQSYFRVPIIYIISKLIFILVFSCDNNKRMCHLCAAAISCLVLLAIGEASPRDSADANADLVAGDSRFKAPVLLLKPVLTINAGSNSNFSYLYVISVNNLVAIVVAKTPLHSNLMKLRKPCCCSIFPIVTCGLLKQRLVDINIYFVI